MLQKLEQKDCPLLPENSSEIASYNHLLDEIARLEKEIPSIVSFLDDFKLELDGVKGRMTRTHYKIGLLGTTQDGKSTALNLILGYGPGEHQDSPARRGSGAATTSNVSRVRRSSSANEKTMKVCYLNQEQYESKKKSLAEAMELNANNLHEQDMLAELRQKTEDPVKIRYVVDFLNAYISHKDCVQKQAKEETVNYDSRGSLLNHAKQGEGQAGGVNKSLLIYEAALNVPTDAINDKCEIIDLPGLGAYPWDNWLTERYLKDVDGVFVFLKTIQITNEAVSKQVFKLKNLWGNEFSNRAWLIFSRFAGQDDVAIPTGDVYDEQKNFFNDANNIIKNFGLDVSHTIFMESQWYKKPGLAELVKNLKNVHIDMPIVQKYPQFKEVFSQLLTDGGIGKLIEIVKDNLPKKVANSISADCAKKINELKDNLAGIEKTARRRLEASTEDLAKYEKCSQGIQKILEDLSGKPLSFEKIIQEFRKFLVAQVDENCSLENATTWTDQELGNRFARISKILDRKYKIEVDTKVLIPSIDTISKTLEDTNTFPKVEILDSETISHAWKKLVRGESEPESSWKLDLPEFENDNLFEQMNHGAFQGVGFDGKSLREVFREKSRIVASQAGHVVRMRLKQILGKLNRELNILASR